MHRTPSNLLRIIAIITVLNLPTSTTALPLRELPSNVQSTQERIFKIKEAELLKDVLRVEEVRNVQSPDFPKGLAIRVRNVSDKEIFGIYIVVVLNQTKDLYSGSPLGFDFDYGESRLVDIKERPSPDAPSLKPGEAHLFSLEDEHAAAMRNQITLLSNDHPELFLSKIFCTIQTINFGDGTGYSTGHPRALRP